MHVAIMVKRPLLLSHTQKHQHCLKSDTTHRNNSVNALTFIANTYCDVQLPVLLMFLLLFIAIVAEIIYAKKREDLCYEHDDPILQSNWKRTSNENIKYQLHRKFSMLIIANEYTHAVRIEPPFKK